MHSSYCITMSEFEYGIYALDCAHWSKLNDGDCNRMFNRRLQWPLWQEVKDAGLIPSSHFSKHVEVLFVSGGGYQSKTIYSNDKLMCPCTASFFCATTSFLKGFFLSWGWLALRSCGALRLLSFFSFFFWQTDHSVFFVRSRLLPSYPCHTSLLEQENSRKGR